MKKDIKIKKFKLNYFKYYKENKIKKNLIK